MAGIVIDVRPDCLNVFASITVTPLGIVNDVRLEQPSKAKRSMTVTPLPSLYVARLEQYQKAYLPISVTLAGMLTEVSPVQRSKA